MKYAEFVREHFGEEYIFEDGDFAITTKKIECMVCCFEKGTKVKIVDVSARGYDLIDEHGNVIIETGWDCIKKEKLL